MHALKTLDKCEKEKWIRKTKKTYWEFHQTNHVKQNSFPITNWSPYLFYICISFAQTEFFNVPSTETKCSELVRKKNLRMGKIMRQSKDI